MKKKQLFFLVAISVVASSVFGQGIGSKQQVLDIIHKVNNYWIDNHPNPGNSFWDNAAYHTGNMEAFNLTGNKKYREYSEKWAEQNQWQGATSNDTANWKYHYGETPDFVLFGDWQICFQTYIDLYHIAPAPHKIARAIGVMEYQMSTGKDDYWWWVDGLYMVMPVMTRLYRTTGNPLYLEKLYEYFSFAKQLMYDGESGLFYRDAKYLYPGHKTVNGKKDFWARGDGWVFAGLTRVLDDLPFSDPHREEYVQVYCEMADAIVACQQPGGFWTRSLLDPEHAPGYETSGTAFFAKGLLWGINNNVLHSPKYIGAALNAWSYLTTVALQEDGKLGFVQPIGEKAIPGQVVDENSTANFGVGAFLLAACEMARFIDDFNWRIGCFYCGKNPRSCFLTKYF